LESTDGQIIGKSSGLYGNALDRDNGIESVKLNAPIAEVHEDIDYTPPYLSDDTDWP
jgi:uncharacterized protein YegP (UPF0339 family)